MKYVYTDRLNNTTFECEARDILAADELYKAAGGRVIVKKKKKKETWEMPPDVTTWSPDWS